MKKNKQKRFNTQKFLNILLYVGLFVGVVVISITSFSELISPTKKYIETFLNAISINVNESNLFSNTNRIISDGDYASFINKAGSDGANLGIFFEGNFSYEKYSNNIVSLDNNLTLTDKELGAFYNKVSSFAEGEDLVQLLELTITPKLENFEIYSVLKISIKDILQQLNKSSEVSYIYLCTTSTVSISNGNVNIIDSAVKINELVGEDLEHSIEVLNLIFKNNETGINVYNLATKYIFNFISDICTKTDTFVSINISDSEGKLIFSL